RRGENLRQWPAPGGGEEIRRKSETVARKPGGREWRVPGCHGFRLRNPGARPRRLRAPGPKTEPVAPTPLLIPEQNEPGFRATVSKIRSRCAGSRIHVRQRGLDPKQA